MATATYKSEGARIDYTPGGDVSAGAVVDIGGFFGIATQAISSGDLGSLAIKGIFAIAKATGASEAISLGVAVYWDSANSQATADATGNDYLGKVVSAATDSDATVDVNINVNE